MLTELGPAERHRAAAADLSAVAAQVSDWGAPTPVEEWAASDVVGHLVTWLPGFLDAGGVTLTVAPDGDPTVHWQRHAEAVQALLDDPTTAQRPFAHPRVPPGSLEATIDAFYTSDVVMHTWDLGRAAGVEVELDPAFCTQLLAGMEPIEQMMRDSGQYGPAFPVPDDADPQTRLVAFIGRDPSWSPPG